MALDEHWWRDSLSSAVSKMTRQDLERGFARAYDRQRERVLSFGLPMIVDSKLRPDQALIVCGEEIVFYDGYEIHRWPRIDWPDERPPGL